MTFHERYVRALRGLGFAPFSARRRFGREGEAFVRELHGMKFVWAYDDYGFEWRMTSDIFANPESELPIDLFFVHASQNLP
ncbi:MAG TPA: hypothetical protein VFT82_00610 [Candidatus Paceibacterota bacterium]|nr:hypothetical protein [Candidatus Paceibacterota bacterium]